MVLAQLGCYVPAAFAAVRPVDRLFTRIGTSDSIETNSSSFMVEMLDTAYLANHATARQPHPAAPPVSACSFSAIYLLARACYLLARATLPII